MILGAETWKQQGIKAKSKFIEIYEKQLSYSQHCAAFYVKSAFIDSVVYRVDIINLHNDDLESQRKSLIILYI